MSDRARTLWGGLLVLVAAAILDATIVAVQEGVPFVYALPGSLIQYGILALLGVAVWSFCGWSAARRGPWVAVVAAHAGMAALVVAVWQAAYLGVSYAISGPVALIPVRMGGLWYFLGSFLTYGMMTAGILLVQTSRRLRDQRQREAELQVLAREAELRALKAQFRPHFFFNVINSLYALVETQPSRAKQMLDQVARLMRQTLELSDQDWVPLEWEVGSVRAYLEIEKIRLGERLEILIDAQASVSDFPVPPLLLQPLVENAIKHGIAPYPGPGQVQVVAREEADGISLVVRDTGPGTTDPGADGDGRGLTITRNRLQALYGAGYSMQTRRREPQGFEAVLHLPRPAEAP